MSDNPPIDFDTTPSSSFNSRQIDDSPPPSRLRIDQTTDTEPDSYLDEALRIQAMQPVPGTATEESNFAQRLKAKLVSQATDTSEHQSKWRRVTVPAAAGALALGIAGGAAFMARTGKAQGRTNQPHAEKTVDNLPTPTTVESPLKRAYESAKVIQQSTPFEFSGDNIKLGQEVSNTKKDVEREVSNTEKNIAIEAIELNHAEFVTGIQLSSGLKINFYQAHITEADANDKLEVDGRAVEMLANHILETAAKLPASNPYSAMMKKAAAEAKLGRMDSTTLTVIISTRGECLDEARQEIINDDMGIKGLCKAGISASGYESNVNMVIRQNPTAGVELKEEAITAQNPTILLSQYKIGYGKSVTPYASPSDVKGAEGDTQSITGEDAEAVAFGHELTHALVAIIGRRILNLDIEHKDLVDLMEAELIKRFVAIPLERKFMSPFRDTQIDSAH